MGEKLNKVILGIMAAILVMLIAVSVCLFIYLKPKTPTKTAPDLSKATELSLGDPIISNIKPDNSSDQTSRYIKLNVSVSIADTTLSTELATKTGQMRDVVYEVVRDKTYNELSAENAMPELRKELKHKLNKLFSTDKIVDVFLSDYTIQ